MSYKYERIIKALPNVLPCNSLEEIADKLARRLREAIGTYDVAMAIARTREAPTVWGMIVPNVKKGPMGPEDPDGRFYCILASDPTFLTEVLILQLLTGLQATQRTAQTLQRRAANVCEKAADKIKSPSLKRALRDQADDLRIIERRAERMIKELVELRAA